MINPTGDVHTLCGTPRCSYGEGHTLPCNEALHLAKAVRQICAGRDRTTAKIRIITR
jgi:hypothetical protein